MFIVLHSPIFDDLNNLFLRDNLQKTIGKVTGVSPKKYFVEVGTMGRFSRSVYCTAYSFTAANGAKYEGVSYQSERLAKVGETVPIEYSKDTPAASQIKGIGKTPVRLFIHWVIVIPLLLGIAFIVAKLREGIKINRLLQNGVQAMGKLISQKKTAWLPQGSIHKNIHFYKLIFGFTAEDRQDYQVKIKVDEYDDLLEGEGKPLLYDPDDPSCAAMLGKLPSLSRINENGEIEADLSVKELLIVALSSLLPIVIVVSCGTYICLKLFNK